MSDTHLGQPGGNVPSVLLLCTYYHQRQRARNRTASMDVYLIAAIVMLVAWGGITLTTDAPGWIHLLLTGGVFLLIWRIVARTTPSRGKGSK